MAWHKSRIILKLFFNRNLLLYFIRTPERDLIRHLSSIIKHPLLYYKTVNVPGLITLEVGTALYEAVLKIKHKSPNIVEIGSYKGLSTIYLAEAAERVNKRVKSFEWFSGLPTVDPILDSNYQTGGLFSSVDEWESNVRKNSSRETVELVIGDARQTILRALNNDGFALAFLDVDLYQTTFDLLVLLGNVIKGGEVIFIHDANSPGIKKAIEEFHALCNYPIKEHYLPDNYTVILTIPLL